MNKKTNKSKEVREQQAITGSNGMAKGEKSTSPPSLIEEPKSIVPI